jgi:hypothetical protein
MAKCCRETFWLIAVLLFVELDVDCLVTLCRYFDSLQYGPLISPFEVEGQKPGTPLDLSDTPVRLR